MSINWRIPPSILNGLQNVPKDQAVVLLLRHSVRNELLDGDAGFQQPITNEGRKIARALGLRLKGRLKTLHSSPLVRCVQTAEQIQLGAQSSLKIENDHLLGDPGAFAIDERAGNTFKTVGFEAVMENLVSQSPPLEGLARSREAAHYMVQHMLTVAGEQPGIHVFVTHDSLITAAASQLLETPLNSEDWPMFLEGAFFWKEESRVSTVYRSREKHDTELPLCGLTESEVIEFARREIAATVGIHCKARFFLAGGAFKALLTGRPPSDLDFWAPTEVDRRLLTDVLRHNGKFLGKHDYNEAFLIRNRIVEVSLKVGPTTLQERLNRFDIGLSAIGVEHSPSDQWQAIINPLALTSVETRTVLLLKPLVNWKYALTTLERLRRYAAELNFDIPEEEEDIIWRTFEEQDEMQRAKMLELFKKSSRGGSNVLEEARCRSR